MKSIVIGIPTRGDDLHWGLAMFLINQAKRVDIKVGFVMCVCPISARRAQEGNLKEMWNTDADYYMTLDTDIVPPEDAIDKMMACDKDVVVAPVWHFDPPSKEIHLNIHYKDLKYRSYLPKQGGMEKIAYASFGCVLMKKSVRDRFQGAGENPIRWSPLLGEQDPMNNMENDNIFFGKCIKLGVEAYVCWDVRGLVHNRRIAMSNEVLSSYYRRASAQEKGDYSAETGIVKRGIL